MDERPLPMSEPVRMWPANLRALLKLMWRTCGGLPGDGAACVPVFGVAGTLLN
jgi:hypothetical protein